MIFYPHYCYDCFGSYVSRRRLAPCRFCGSENIINCYRETMKADEIEKHMIEGTFRATIKLFYELYPQHKDILNTVLWDRIQGADRDKSPKVKVDI